MNLTAQQGEAMTQLRAFLDGEERCFVLKGYAGTGKTFLIGHLAHELANKSREAWLLAPTGRAARVLSRKTGIEASTIHRAIYNLKELVEHDDKTVAFKFYFRLKDVATDNLDLVVIVDESSMVSDKYSEGEFLRFGSGRLLADLLTYLRLTDHTQKTKLIFVGDPAQLPPVNMPTSPALDPTYLKDEHNISANEYELTDVVRQAANNPILVQATEIRKTLLSKCHNKLSIAPSPPNIEEIKQSDLPARYLLSNADARLPRTICVAYSNATCLNLNVAIRAHRFGAKGENPPSTTDVLLVIRNNASTGLLNGDVVSVLWADTIAESVSVRVGIEHATLTFRSVRILAEAEDGNLVEVGTKIVENILFSEKRDLSPLEQKALYVHFKMRYPALRPNTKEFTEALRTDPYFNALQVKFGYAMTCHKAQGGEWEDVFVVFENSRTDALALRWAYTAITRARSRILGVGLPNRTPWAALNAVPLQNVIPVAKEVATDVSAKPLSRPAPKPTRWDGLFPDQPAFLLASHRQVANLLEDSGIALEDVQVRPQNYFWRYCIERQSRRATIQIYFTRQGGLNPQILAMGGADQSLAEEALRLVRSVRIAIATAPAPVDFPNEKPFLREFCDDYMEPRAHSAAGSIVKVEHLQYRERYFVASDGRQVVLDAIYNAKGVFTRIDAVEGDAELLAKFMDGE